MTSHDANALSHTANCLLTFKFTLHICVTLLGPCLHRYRLRSDHIAVTSKALQPSPVLNLWHHFWTCKNIEEKDQGEGGKTGADWIFFEIEECGKSYQNYLEKCLRLVLQISILTTFRKYYFVQRYKISSPQKSKSSTASTFKTKRSSYLTAQHRSSILPFEIGLVFPWSDTNNGSRLCFFQKICSWHWH